MTLPANHRKEMNENEKGEICLFMARSQNNSRNMRVMVMPLVVGALTTFIKAWKDQRKNRESLDYKIMEIS